MIQFKQAVKKLVHRLFPASLASLYDKAEDVLWYIFFGVMTTAVNFLVYTLLIYVVFAKQFAQNKALVIFYCNWIAWGVAALSSFVFNRCFVFENHDKGFPLLAQFVSFMGLRLASGVLENSLPSLLVDITSMHHYVAKVLVAVLVIILNYLFSKFITFRRSGKRSKVENSPLCEKSTSNDTEE